MIVRYLFFVWVGDDGRGGDGGRGNPSPTAVLDQRMYGEALRLPYIKAAGARLYRFVFLRGAEIRRGWREQGPTSSVSLRLTPSPHRRRLYGGRGDEYDYPSAPLGHLP